MLAERLLSFTWHRFTLHKNKEKGEILNCMEQHQALLTY